MSRHRIEIEVTVDDDVLREERDSGPYRGPPDAWINLGDIEWALGVAAISADAPITDYTEVPDAS